MPCFIYAILTVGGNFHLSCKLLEILGLADAGSFYLSDFIKTPYSLQHYFIFISYPITVADKTVHGSMSKGAIL